MSGTGGTARPRLVFRSVHVYREGHRAEAQVELFAGDRTCVGRAEGIAVRGGLVRLVALASLDCLRPLLAPQQAVDLVAVGRKRVGGRLFLMTHLVLLEGREERHLSGSVVVTSDPLEATVFSVLDALNRLLLGGERAGATGDVGEGAAAAEAGRTRDAAPGDAARSRSAAAREEGAAGAAPVGRGGREDAPDGRTPPDEEVEYEVGGLDELRRDGESG